MINILILSVGTRNKIVQYFKKELNDNGLVIATDCNELAPALYDADKSYIVPKITDEKYLDVILDICKKEKINAVLSLIDPELSLISLNKDKFLEIGTTPIVSEYDDVELCLDKYKTFNFLKENGFKTIKSYVDKEVFYKDVEEGRINYPVFVKPVKGSASLNINKVFCKDQLELLFSQHNNLIIQEYMDGKEYGVDAYIDMISNELVSIFIKEKIKMRAGETDKSISLKNEKITNLVKELIQKSNFKGVIDIDIFEKYGEYYISEVNPRFGGGNPHAYECGVNIPKMIIKNLQGEINKPQINNYKEDIYMMKYNEIKVMG